MYADLTKHEAEHLRMLCKLDETFHPSMNRSCIRKLDRSANEAKILADERRKIRVAIIKKEREVSRINHAKNNLKAQLVSITKQLDERRTLWKHIKYVFGGKHGKD